MSIIFIDLVNLFYSNLAKSFSIAECFTVDDFKFDLEVKLYMVKVCFIYFDLDLSNSHLLPLILLLQGLILIIKGLILSCFYFILQSFMLQR